MEQKSGIDLELTAQLGLTVGHVCPKIVLLRISNPKGVSAWEPRPALHDEERRQMSPQEFLSKAKRYARENDLRFEFLPHRGKGSHGVLLLGDRRTVVKMSGSEIPTGTLHAMLKQLGLKLKDLHN